MRKQKNQSGFAHMGILVIVLVIALIGTLGFVYYQNFVQKTDTSTDTPLTEPTSDANNTTAEDPNKGYIVLNDWGVKFKKPTSLGNNQVTYRKSGSVYQFSTSDIESIGASCKLTNYPLGVISRYSGSAPVTAGILVGKIDGYLYYANSAMATCSNSKTDIQGRDLNIIKNLLLSVEKS